MKEPEPLKIKIEYVGTFYDTKKENNMTIPEIKKYLEQRLNVYGITLTASTIQQK